MICALTARRITEGKADEFIEQFGGGGEDLPAEVRERFTGVYACTDVNDPDVVLTFGLFDGTIEEFRELQSSESRTEQLENIDPLIEDILVDGSFEVVREFISEGSRPPTAARARRNAVNRPSADIRA